MKCTQCHEIHPKWIGINREEEYEVAGGRGGTANFVWKCGSCKREANAKFDAASPTKPYSSENGQLEPFLTLECRNLEFIGFDPKVRQTEMHFCRLSVNLNPQLKGPWKCVGAESGTAFDDVDLSEGEWTDYDEKVSQSPSGLFSRELVG